MDDINVLVKGKPRCTVLTDHEAMDALSGTAVLNGIPVEIVAAS